MTATQLPLLVTGASGQLGRRVIAHMLDAHKVPPAQIIATTRKPESLADLAAKGVVVRQADFSDTDALTQAFAGAQRLLLISTDAIMTPGERLQQHRNAVAAAQKAGVKHVVYTSMPKPEPGSPIPFAPDHYGTEQALASSSMGFTVLRNSWYMENLFMSLPQVLKSGQWFTAAGEGRVAHVARDDTARVAAAALASDFAGRATYTVTGPDALTTAEIAVLVSEVSGRPIQVIPLTPEQLTQGMLAAGLPEPLARLLVAFDVNTKAGNVAEVTDAVQKLTGLAPQKLGDFLLANKGALSG
jgi:NAD(P)H dehydrogenase (quinone)